MGVGGPSSPAILEIDLATGDRAVLSGVLTGSGPLFAGEITGLARSQQGSLLATTTNLYLVGPALVDVNITTGQRTLVSGGSTGTGPALAAPQDVAVASDGTVSVIDSGQVLRIDVPTGDRSVVSSAAVGTGAPLAGPHSLAAYGAGATAVPLLPVLGWLALACSLAALGIRRAQ